MEKNNDLTELQLKHQQQMKEKRDAIKLRKQRTHRLIVRGAIAENAIEGALAMTDEQFQEALLQAIRKSGAIATSHPPRKCPSGESVGRPCGAALGRAHGITTLGVMYKCALLRRDMATGSVLAIDFSFG